MATILFEPKASGHDGVAFTAYEYILDTTGNFVADRNMWATKSETRSRDLVFDTLTQYYLKQGTKFIFDDSGLKPFENTSLSRIISIEINGNMVELTEMFPLDVIRWRLPQLWAKLVREGRNR